MSALQLQRKAWPVDAYADEADFAPIFDHLVAAFPDVPVAGIGDDEWASLFLPKGNELVERADALRSSGAIQEAITYYMCVPFLLSSNLLNYYLHSSE